MELVAQNKKVKDDFAIFILDLFYIIDIIGIKPRRTRRTRRGGKERAKSLILAVFLRVLRVLRGEFLISDKV